MAIETRIVGSGKQVTAPRQASLSQRWKKVGVTERMLFTERLALLLETGVALHAALKALTAQTVNPQLAEIIQATLDDVLQGKPLSQALSRHPQMFSGTYVNLIAASETGGFMHEVLKQLVAMDEKQERLRSTLFSALAYPSFLIVFSIAVVVFVLVMVFPKFAEMFSSIRDQLPWTTLFLIALSDILRHYWLLVIGAICAGAYILELWLKKPGAAAARDRLMLKLPVVKEVIIQVYLTRIMRTMGVSLTNGVTVVDSLRDCKDIVVNLQFRTFMAKVHNQVIEGRGIAAAFAEADFIPAIVCQMIATGEQAGRLGPVMERIADFYERELTKRITTLSKLAEPLMLLVMGAAVGLIVSSLILPIFKLSRAVH